MSDLENYISPGHGRSGERVSDHSGERTDRDRLTLRQNDLFAHGFPLKSSAFRHLSERRLKIAFDAFRVDSLPFNILIEINQRERIPCHQGIQRDTELNIPKAK